MTEFAPESQSFVTLDDGRRLTYSCLGPAHGTPVFYMHGAIGTPMRHSRELARLIDELEILYVMPNRPGFGGSDLAPGRTIRDFAADTAAIADALGIDYFAITGVSAGGPYALACAHELCARVTAVSVCSSLSPLCAPHETPGIRKRLKLCLALLASRPDLCERIGTATLPLLRRNPGLLRTAIAIGASRADREVIDDPQERQTAVESFMHATAWGVRGMVDDYGVYARVWGFSPASIETEVHVWHGMADALVPVEHALQLAASLPSCRAFLDPDEGHHFFRRRLGAILGTLVGRPTPQLPAAGLEVAA